MKKSIALFLPALQGCLTVALWEDREAEMHDVRHDLVPVRAVLASNPEFERGADPWLEIRVEPSKSGPLGGLNVRERLVVRAARTEHAALCRMFDRAARGGRSVRIGLDFDVHAHGHATSALRWTFGIPGEEGVRILTNPERISPIAEPPPDLAVLDGGPGAELVVHRHGVLRAKRFPNGVRVALTPFAAALDVAGFLLYIWIHICGPPC